MNFLSALKQIEASSTFKNFKKEHKDAYLCAGFFVLDYEQGRSEQQLDYSLEDGKIFTFSLTENEVTLKEAETIEGKKQKLLKLKPEIKIDLDKVEEILKKEMQEQEISSKVNKIIAVLQENEGKQIWNLNCILSSMEILQVHIDADSGEILKFEKRSMFEFVKRVK